MGSAPTPTEGRLFTPLMGFMGEDMHCICLFKGTDKGKDKGFWENGKMERKTRRTGGKWTRRTRNMFGKTGVASKPSIIRFGITYGLRFISLEWQLNNLVENMQLLAVRSIFFTKATGSPRPCCREPERCREPVNMQGIRLPAWWFNCITAIGTSALILYPD